MPLKRTLDASDASAKAAKMHEEQLIADARLKQQQAAKKLGYDSVAAMHSMPHHYEDGRLVKILLPSGEHLCFTGSTGAERLLKVFAPCTNEHGHTHYVVTKIKRELTPPNPPTQPEQQDTAHELNGLLINVRTLAEQVKAASPPETHSAIDSVTSLYFRRVLPKQQVRSHRLALATAAPSSCSYSPPPYCSHSIHLSSKRRWLQSPASTACATL